MDIEYKEYVSKRNSVFLEKIGFHNFLSFLDCRPVSLLDINVLIGPNASGKSNFFKGIQWLEFHFSNIIHYLSLVGGKHQFMNYLTTSQGRSSLLCELKALQEGCFFDVTLDYLFDVDPDRSLTINEQILIGDNNSKKPLAIRSGNKGRFHLSRYKDVRLGKSTISKGALEIVPNSEPVYFDISEKDAETESLLKLVQNPNEFAAQKYLQQQCSSIWLGSNRFVSLNSIRNGQATDLRRDVIWGNFENLIPVLNMNLSNKDYKTRLLDYISRVHNRVNDIHIEVQANRMFLHLYEDGYSRSTPATHLSDGTLYYICLVALFIDPNPPPLICFEEPEVGLHPGVIHVLADLFLEASKTTQVLIATHSDILVDAIGKHRKDAILICEWSDNQTCITRPDQDVLEKWLEKYSLGELWLKGELGGTP